MDRPSTYILAVILGIRIIYALYEKYTKMNIQKKLVQYEWQAMEAAFKSLEEK